MPSAAAPSRPIPPRPVLQERGGALAFEAGPLRAAGAGVEWLFLGDWRARLATRTAHALVLLLAVLLAGFLSFKAVGNQITETNLLREDRVNLALYLDGTAYKPFVYRVLNPVLVRFAEDLGAPGLLRALPGPIAQKLPEWCGVVAVTPAPTCDDVAAYASPSCCCSTRSACGCSATRWSRCSGSASPSSASTPCC